MIYEDYVITNTWVYVSLADRLKLLWSGKAWVHTKVPTQNVVGIVGKTESFFRVLPRGWKRVV